MDNLEKIVLSVLAFSLIYSVACEKKERVPQTEKTPKSHYSQKIELYQSPTNDVTNVIDKYYSTIQNNDREGYLNCLTKRSRDIEERYSHNLWKEIVNSKMGKTKIKSRKLIGSSGNRKIYEILEFYETNTGIKKEESYYYYLVKEDSDWKIDRFEYNLNTNWLKTGKF